MVVTWMLTLNSNAVFSWTGLKTCITSLHVLVRIILDFLKVRIRVTQSLNAHFWLHKELTCGKSRTIWSRFILCGIIWILMSKAISLCIFTKTVFEFHLVLWWKCKMPNVAVLLSARLNRSLLCLCKTRVACEHLAISTALQRSWFCVILYGHAISLLCITGSLLTPYIPVCHHQDNLLNVVHPQI